MSKATSMRRHQSNSSSGEYRKRLRSYQTPVRRSPRFLPQNDNNVVEFTAKKQPNSTKKPSFSKTHLQSPPITPAPTQISPPKRTQHGCSAKCPNELLRSIENLQGSSNPSQGKPLRRSARLSLIPSLETAKEPVEPVKERRLSPRLMGCAKVPEGKENVHTDGLGDEKGDANLGTRKAKEKKVREKEKENGERDGLVNLKTEEGVDNEKKKKKLKICEENVGSEKLDAGECCGSGDWTKEEDAILQRAYLVANPSPHFWKKVARMVPGKSAQDCFDRVNGSFATPPQPQPRSRANRSHLSPVSNFSLSGSRPIQHPIPVVKKLSSRKKNLVAQKTVRHLLRKHCVNDQNREVDHFSVLETSPTALAAELPVASSPISPNCLSSPDFLQKCSGWSSSAHKKMLSRFKPLAEANQPSPEVLKRIKNMALHEKYIDQLHNRDARRKYVASSSAADRVSKNEGEKKTGVLKAAKTALMSEAKEFISHFQHMRANPQGETDTDDDKEEEEEDDE